MSQRIPKSIWLIALLAAIVLGIWPGVALGQEHYVWFSAFSCAADRKDLVKSY